MTAERLAQYLFDAVTNVDDDMCDLLVTIVADAVQTSNDSADSVYLKTLLRELATRCDRRFQ